jgi:hypothetical protein
MYWIKFYSIGNGDLNLVELLFMAISLFLLNVDHTFLGQNQALIEYFKGSLPLINFVFVIH